MYLPGAGWIGLDPTSGLLRRRRSHSARRHARAFLRRADLRRRGRVRSQVHARDVGDAHPRRSARHAAVYRCAMAAHPGAGRPHRSGHLQRTTFASPWAANRPSSPSTTWTARSGTSPLWARKSASWPSVCSIACESASPPAACCITAKANGIRASRCRAGRSPAIGAPTVFRCGTIARCCAQEQLPQRLRPAGSAAFRRDAGAPLGARSRLRQPGLRRSALLFAERAPAAGQCRSGGQPAGGSRGNASASARFSSAGSTRPSALCCRSSASRV